MSEKFGGFDQDFNTGLGVGVKAGKEGSVIVSVVPPGKTRRESTSWSVSWDVPEGEEVGTAHSRRR